MRAVFTCVETTTLALEDEFRSHSVAFPESKAELEVFPVKLSGA
jgi:hypothetical protein